MNILGVERCLKCLSFSHHPTGGCSLQQIRRWCAANPQKGTFTNLCVGYMGKFLDHFFWDRIKMIKTWNFPAFPSHVCFNVKDMKMSMWQQGALNAAFLFGIYCRLWGFHCGSRVSMTRDVTVSSVSHHVLRPWTCWMIHRWTVQSLEGRDTDLLFGLVVAHLNNLFPACPSNPYLDPFFRLFTIYSGDNPTFFLPGTPFGVLFRLEWMQQPGISMAHPATSATESRSLEGFLMLASASRWSPDIIGWLIYLHQGIQR